MMLVRLNPIRTPRLFIEENAAQRAARLIDRLFDDRFPWGFERPTMAARTELAARLEVKDADADYTALLKVPGYAKEGIEVAVEDGILKITGKKTDADGKGEETFMRAVALPGKIADEGHTAKVEDGVLTVTLRKTEPLPATPVKIAIE